MSSAVAWGVKDWCSCTGCLVDVADLECCGGKDDEESDAEEEDEVLGDLVSRYTS